MLMMINDDATYFQSGSSHTKHFVRLSIMCLVFAMTGARKVMMMTKQAAPFNCDEDIARLLKQYPLCTQLHILQIKPST